MSTESEPCELTSEQKKILETYRDKWIARGLDTTQVDLKTAEEILNPWMVSMLKITPVPVILVDNPIKAWEKVAELTGTDVSKYEHAYQDGQYFCSTFAYYDFLISEKIITIPDELVKTQRIWEETSRLGPVYPLSGACVVSQKPVKTMLNDRGALHCETGPALVYTGWNLYALNGVPVPEWLVMTPSEDLSINLYLKETNADVKAEFVRKFGVERMLSLGKKIDSYENYDQEENPWWWKSEYELWNMGVLFDIDYQPYLKMKNQTTGIWHVEAISPECLTLRDAIKERFGGREMRIISIS